MAAGEILTQLVIGGLLGLVGQGIRSISGFKKLHDQASAQNQTASDLFDPPRFVISLIIGFIAGVLAVVVQMAPGTPVDFTGKGMVMLIAAGYAGTDFIESFMAKYLPGQGNGDGKNPGAANGNGGGDKGTASVPAAPPSVG